MLKFIPVFLQFISFSLGISALAVSSYHYLKNRERPFKYYTLFLILITIRIVFNNILIILRSGYEPSDTGLMSYIILIHQISADATFLMLFTVPFFIHALLSVPFGKQAGIVFTVLLIIFGILDLFPYLFGLYGVISYYPVQDIARAGNIVMAGIFIYLVLVAFFYLPRTSDMQKKIASAVIIVFFISFLFFDYSMSKNAYLFNWPHSNHYLYLYLNIGFYSFWNIFFLGFVFFSRNLPGGGMETLEISKAFLARYGITQREKEVIGHVLSGKSNLEIAEILFISVKTVKNHIHNIFMKTNVKSRMELLFMVKKYQNES